MHYKIILSNTSDTIPIKDDELENVLTGISKGKIVITKNGIFNPSYFVAIIADKERERTEAELKQYNYKLEEPSPFAKLLGKKMQMLSDGDRTQVQEEVARLERKNKR
ncbi:MAG TPA: hypothetical protein PK455_05910 [Caldisericia bacterium]|nr:hypothetical protein [Caldisericia bacterium]